MSRTMIEESPVFIISLVVISLIGISSINQSEVALAQLQPLQQQEAHNSGGNALSYESSQLGIKIKYPLSWKVFSEQTWEGCFDKINTCVVTFAPNYTTELRPSVDIQFEIVKTSFKKDPLEHNPCHNCDSLIDSVRYHYQGIVEGIDKSPYSDNFEFINDNQTTIGGNNSAWLIEYKDDEESSFDNGTYHVHHLELITKFNGSDYIFSYNAPSMNDFVKYLPVVKSMINSVEFISAANKPSFLP